MITWIVKTITDTIIIPRRDIWSVKQVEEKQTNLPEAMHTEGGDSTIIQRNLLGIYILGPGDFCYDTIITNLYTRNFIQRKQ